MKLQVQEKAEQSRKSLDCLALIAQERSEAAAKKQREEEKVGVGIQKSRVGGKSIKKLNRENRSTLNLPYWKSFLMALRSRKKQQHVKGGTAACVKEAAKICHSSKSKDDWFLEKLMEIRKASMLDTKKNYYNRKPTFIGYSDNYKKQPYDYSTTTDFHTFSMTTATTNDA